ncbi:hypothetical protein A3A79_05090 [Candidatus Gottesmanbacteria bacterium RIFCSPLOWO2_01_FULL_43_11b]|uniref:Glycosyltransferase subfamily 4-like N-terminal domain-containing protein n=1 Tax=Candidatus Gottesmanbacteria bacterium RIFCSPLOWO2_01_FULL_43_11b TaxID=1798392 RepID=A0A1F6AIH5_9BACT|nr:MAG: hypothetical protein A3A79_05090 [Candidatus Gottesmanbacteria bacterium RIFCSPLOWO2_01_FULL_43_11b]
MRIGIDISQIVYEGTGVGNYVRHMVTELLKHDTKNEYVLFGASLRRRKEFREYFPKKHLVIVPIPPTLLDILWNRFHIFPVEWFTGSLDVFWSSDWTQPPLIHAKGVTTIHDLTVFRHPESFVTKIIEVQRRRLTKAAKLCSAFFCDSEATKKDAIELLGIPQNKLFVVYPGI